MIEEKLQRLIRLEWEEFQNVHNKGSRAPCQDDRKTFWIMRSSLFAPWSEEMIDSWYDDLLTARAEGHELVAEKSAWMMERTAPEEFQQIKHLLKVPSGESLALIAEIISLEMRGMDEYRKTYPYLAAQNRDFRSEADTENSISFETYLWGELHTYSVRTLRLYFDMAKRLQSRNSSMALSVMEHTVKAYSYASLEDAEQQCKERFEASSGDTL